MTRLKSLGIYFPSSVVAALMLLAMAYPHHPTTWTGWLELLAIALPVTLAGEAIGIGLMRIPLARDRDGKTFCWARLAGALLALLLVFGFCLGIAVFFEARGWL